MEFALVWAVLLISFFFILPNGKWCEVMYIDSKYTILSWELEVANHCNKIPEDIIVMRYSNPNQKLFRSD